MLAARLSAIRMGGGLGRVALVRARLVSQHAVGRRLVPQQRAVFLQGASVVLAIPDEMGWEVGMTLYMGGPA